MSELVEVLFLCISAVVLVLLLTLICLHLYEIFEEPKIQKEMRRLRKSAQPWVTVLVYARNSEATIGQSLQSLARSRYYYYDIVVVDDNSHDKTVQKVQQFKQAHPRMYINTLRRRTHGSTEQALRAGYRKSRKGEVIISLQAGVIIGSSFIKRAAAVSRLHESYTLRVREKVQIHSLSEIIHSLENIIWQRSYKAQIGTAKNSMRIKKSVNLDFVGVTMLLVLILTSVLIHEEIIYWYSWLIATSYVAAVIWLYDEKIKTKLTLSFSAIPALFLLPVASIVMAFSQFHSRN